MTDLPTYRPFGSSDDEYEQLLVLREGVPADLREPIVGWLHDQLTVFGMMGSYVSQELADKVRMLSGIDLGVTNDSYISGEDLNDGLRRLSPHLVLRLVDALLYLGSNSGNGIESMSELLRLGRSKFHVGPRNGTVGLVERIAEGEQSSVDRLSTSAGTAGALLQQSFSAAYGLQTNAHQVIEPNNTGATLGTMLNVMRNAPIKWTLPLEERADHAHGNEQLLISMMQSIWDGQEDRHRDGKVELSEARAAFHMAVALVGWFHDGLVRQGPQ
jgi:hypothetical protein